MHMDSLCNMEIIFLFLVFLEAGSWETEAVSLTGNLHSDITIKCSHANAYSNVKYFCKGACNYEDVLITSKQKNVGRYSIEDEGNTFFVTIRGLTQEDAGTYWCGIERAGIDTYNEVVLTVVKVKAQDADNDLLKSNAEKLAYIGAGLGVAVLALVMVLVIFFRRRKRDISASSAQEDDNSNDRRTDSSRDHTDHFYSVTVLSEAQKQPGGLCYSTVSFKKSRDDSTDTPLPASTLPTSTVTYSTIADMSTDDRAVYCNV